MDVGRQQLPEELTEEMIRQAGKPDTTAHHISNPNGPHDLSMKTDDRHGRSGSAGVNSISKLITILARMARMTLYGRQDRRVVGVAIPS